MLNGKKITGNLLSHNDLKQSNTYLGFVLWIIFKYHNSKTILKNIKIIKNNLN